MSPRNRVVDSLITTRGSWDPKFNWLELPAEVQRSIEGVFTERRAFTLSEKKTDYGTSIDFSIGGSEESISDHYRLIAVPRFIRDRRHRKLLLAHLKSFLPPSKRHEKWLDPNGRVLGYPHEWEAYLLHKYWREKGCGTLHARALAALRIYKPLLYIGLSEDYLLTPAALKDKERKAIIQKRSSEVTDAAKRIEAHIASVFPAFEAFEFS